jgi:hypothetical protein
VKGSLKLRPRRVLSRKEAWACFTANLALPGSGSLAAGRAVGYAQLAAAFASIAFTGVASIPMFQWALSGGLTTPQTAMDDPSQNLLDLWIHMRWPLASICFFGVVIFWATMTSRDILAKAPKDDVPPIIQ